MDIILLWLAMISRTSLLSFAMGSCGIALPVLAINLGVPLLQLAHSWGHALTKREKNAETIVQQCGWHAGTSWYFSLASFIAFTKYKRNKEKSTARVNERRHSVSMHDFSHVKGRIAPNFAFPLVFWGSAFLYSVPLARIRRILSSLVVIRSPGLWAWFEVGLKYGISCKCTIGGFFVF